ncbi:hypothetical protein BDV32DRAFT_23739 [Aspergillus pseudonomiae]|nr:hypothetical protein BDV32DRAFT_23739 [Aspergillus pseudonomiae]
MERCHQNLDLGPNRRTKKVSTLSGTSTAKALVFFFLFFPFLFLFFFNSFLVPATLYLASLERASLGGNCGNCAYQPIGVTIP